MQSRRIARGSPESIYISVRNCGSVSLEVGHHAMFAYHSSSFGDGVNVCTYSSTADMGLWQMAGVVSRYPIPSGAKGLVQVYGHHNSISCSAPAGGVGDWTAAQVSVISPMTTTSGMNTLVTQGAWATYPGGVIRLVDSSNADGETTGTGYWPGFIRML
jgi:hypothetical protein